ncbi:MAG: NAD(P)/FAD-dependent oxidoreductase [Euryarchaeota archaeon]|jgi:digeranylgeranylglycerophospholipid reductase|nr:NAD(P)/FAD-dependent oxidoreductase [Euryarchaeota archaeon]
MSERSEPEHRQVLVVGAGPGGSTAANRLAEAGMDVLVIERRNTVGNPAQCGECVPVWGEMSDAFPLIKDDAWLNDYWQFPDHVLGQYLDWMRVYTPSMKEYGFGLDCYGAHRLQFDGHLADRAVSNGAEIRTATELRKVQKQKKLNREVYRTNNGSFTADYVIDASGALAHVGRLRGGVERPGVQLPTINAQVSGHDSDSFDIFMGSVAPRGYAWIIPKGEIANVGIGVHYDNLGIPLKQRLDTFCEGLDLTIHSYGGGWIPLGGKVKSAVNDNVLAVGDAAGLVMPSNGGGIGQAIVSGKFAADTIISNLNGGASLSAYDRALTATMGKQLRISRRSKNLFWTFCRNDFTTELAMRLLGTNGLRRAVDCRRPFGII